MLRAERREQGKRGVNQQNQKKSNQFAFFMKYITIFVDPLFVRFVGFGVLNFVVVVVVIVVVVEEENKNER